MNFMMYEKKCRKRGICSEQRCCFQTSVSKERGWLCLHAADSEITHVVKHVGVILCVSAILTLVLSLSVVAQMGLQSSTHSIGTLRAPLLPLFFLSRGSKGSYFLSLLGCIFFLITC